MYLPPAFAVEERPAIHAMIRGCGLANLVTAGADGPMATPLPLLLDESEGEMGVLYGHLARANPHWKSLHAGDALAIFMGPDAYITPSWYPSKAEHGRVVPTWNYQTVHARGPVEFFDDPVRLRSIVKRLTERHEGTRSAPWSIDDAPEAFVQAQLRAIVGLKLTITSLEGKSKMSQNRNAADRQGVAQGLAASENPQDRFVAGLIRKEDNR